MKTLENKKAQIEKLQKEVKALEDKERLEQEKNKDKIIWTKITELNIEISQQIYNNKTYSEILELVSENQIVTHDMLFKLRSLTDKYPQFKEFWVFCPNPDKISKSNNFVARFDADSNGAYFYCGRGPADRVDRLGVFLWRKLK